MSETDLVRAWKTDPVRFVREQFGVGWCYYIEFNEALTEGVVHRDAVRPGLASLAGIELRNVTVTPELLRLLSPPPGFPNL